MKTELLATGCVIRLVQLRLWEDCGASILYDDILLCLAGGKPQTMTPEQMERTKLLKAMIHAIESMVRSDDERYAIYHRIGLVNDRESYDRVFYPKNFDEQYGGFGNECEALINTPQWQADRENWERQNKRLLEYFENERKSRIKAPAPKPTPVEPQTPAVRAFYVSRYWGQNRRKKLPLRSRNAESPVTAAFMQGSIAKKEAIYER